MISQKLSALPYITVIADIGRDPEHTIRDPKSGKESEVAFLSQKVVRCR